MKLKYKKIILLVSLGTMVIGCVTLSVGNTSKKQTKPNVAVEEEVDILGKDFDSESYSTSGEEMVLEKDKYPEVNKLVQDYYDAQLTVDTDKLAKLVTDSLNIDEAELRHQSEMIQGYKNIECYTIKGKAKGSYFVYVYNEVKLTGVDTLAPGLNGLYLVPDESGKLRVFNGTMDSDTLDYKEKVDSCEGVEKLISATNTRYLEAMQSDHELYEFYQGAEKNTEK